MISKNLFFKILKEDMKLRVWTVALFSIVLFLVFPVMGAMRIQSRDGASFDYNDKIFLLKELLGPHNEMFMILIVLCAVVCGLSSFFYLYSKKKVDLYHSLPVKREVIFCANYINGLLVLLVPYVISILITVGEAALNRLFPQEVLMATLNGIMIHFLYYWMIYTVTIIAVIITGNIWTSFLGAMVLMSYGLILAMAKSSYFNAFFETYFSMDAEGVALQKLSPVMNYFRTIQAYDSSEPYALNLLIQSIITLVLMGIALFLFKKRPSEAAGRAIAFEKSKTPIKFLLVIPLSLISGILLRESVSNNYDGWLIFGIVFFMVIIYGIIQVIFNSDIRSAFGQKRHLLICALVTFAVVGYFRIDPFQYDEYIPKENDIKSIGIELNFRDDEYAFIYSGSNMDYSSSVDYHLQHPLKKDLSSIYSLCKSAIKGKISNDVYYSDGYHIVVKYNLKSGRSVYRRYNSKLDDNTLVKALYDNQQYKEVHFPIFTDVYSDISFIDCSEGYSMEDRGELTNSITLSEDKMVNFLDIYKEELANIPYDQYMNATPVASLRVQLLKRKYGGGEYYVFPSFTKSIAYLKECGLNIK